MPWQRLRSDVASVLFGSQRWWLRPRLLVAVAGGHWRKRRERRRRRNGAWRILSRRGRRLTG